jgi:hypothetical protein
MATYDFTSPAVSTASATKVIDDIKAIAEASAVMWNESQSLFYVPTNAVRWNTSSKLFQLYNGASWGNLEIANIVGSSGVFAIDGTRTALNSSGSSELKIIADNGNTGTTTYDPIATFNVYATERARIYTDTSDSHKLKFDVGGSDQMVIDSSGNVGIGTSSPAYELDVRGNATSDHGQISLGNSDASKFLMSISGHSGDNPAIFWENTQDLRFATASNPSGTSFTERMRIDSSGNVGIGTSSPSQLLQVGGDVRGQIYIDGTSTGTPTLTLDNTSKSNGRKWALYAGGARAQNFDILDLSTTPNATTRFSIDENGKVGIGTSSPSRQLDIENISSNPFVSLVTSTTRDAGIFFGDTDSDSRGRVYYQNSVDDMSFYTAGTEKVRISSSGNVEVNNGNLVIGTSGKGIDFSATSGTGTSELLDDYEEGTFTPTLTTTGTGFSSVTYDASVSGSYTKVGRKVFFTLFIGTDAVTKGSASGGITVAGLPFTSNSTLGVGRSVVRLTASNFLADAPIVGTITENTSYIQLSKRATSVSGDTALQVADIGTGANANFMSISGSYQI